MPWNLPQIGSKPIALLTQFCYTRSDFQRNYSRACVVCFRLLLYFCWQTIASVTLKPNCIRLAVAKVYLSWVHVSHVRVQQHCSRIAKAKLKQAPCNRIALDLRQLKCSHRAHKLHVRVQQNCSWIAWSSLVQFSALIKFCANFWHTVTVWHNIGTV